MEKLKHNSNKLRSLVAIGLASTALTAGGAPVEAMEQPPRIELTTNEEQFTPPLAPPSPERVDIQPELLRAWQEIIAKNPGRIDVALFDSRTGSLTSTYTDGGSFYPASIVKLPIAIELFRKDPAYARAHMDDMQRMISHSDNDATARLFTRVGSVDLEGLYRDAGLATTHTTGGNWSASTTAAADQVRLVNMVAYPSPLIAPEDAATILDLMYHTAPDQRWGVPSGLPADASSANKNGWYADSCNSIGLVNGQGVNYTMAIISDHDPSNNSYCTDFKETSRQPSAATWQIMRSAV